MGYRVEYQPIKKVRGLEKRTIAVPAMTALCFLTFLLFVNSVWPRGGEVLRGLFFSGDMAVTVSALEFFAEELETGETFSSALESFCYTVIQESALDPN